MAAPAHYIRTIHTSFTAAHPSGAWANAASNTARSHSNVLLTVNNNPHHPYHQYQQAQAQLQVQHKYPPGLGLPSGSGGRRRARNPPSSSSYASQPRPPYKFDPFADEPLYTSPSPPPSSQPFSATHSVLYNTPAHTPPSSSHPLLYSTPSRPYTIQIPPAGPTEVIRATSSTSRFYELSAADKEAKAKLVAGILLNRVHAVGKPMRRRPSVDDQPRAYVKSGLSRVVSVEA